MKKGKHYTKVKSRIDKLTNQGLDVAKALGGKTIEQLSSNLNAFNAFDKRYKRVMERPKILKELQVFKQQREEKKIKKQQTEKVKKAFKIDNLRSQISETIREQKDKVGGDIVKRLALSEVGKEHLQFQFLDNITDTNKLKDILKQIKKTTIADISEKASETFSVDFRERYFQELMVYPQHAERVEKLFAHLEKDYNELTSFIDHVVKRNELEFLDTDNARELGISSKDLLLLRLDKMEEYAIQSFNYKRE